jgi:hypothetical protein
MICWGMDPFCQRTPMRKKAMPHEVYVARHHGPLDLLVWEGVNPLLPRGEQATRYVRADIADDLLAALRGLLGECDAMQGAELRGDPVWGPLMEVADAAIAKAEGR